MMQLTAAMVGMLGGPALQVLIILQIERQPRALSFIMDMANLSDKTASAAVRKLKTHGMITEQGRFVYQIAGEVQQLPLMAQELTEEVSADDKTSDSVDLGRKISDIDTHACMHESESINTLTNNSAEPTCLHEQDGNSDLAEKPKISKARAELLWALDLAAVRDPAYSRLLQRRGLTGRTVRYHVKQAPSLGAAITRIEQNWRVPDEFERMGYFTACGRCSQVMEFSQNLYPIEGKAVCYECMSEEEYDKYGPDDG